MMDLIELANGHFITQSEWKKVVEQHIKKEEQKKLTKYLQERVQYIWLKKMHLQRNFNRES